MWTRVWLAPLSCCIQLAISFWLTPYVRAQEPRDPAHYEMLIDEGIREYDLHNFVEARSLLMRAHVHFPNARALRAIGMAEFELGNHVASAAALAAALASEVRPLEDGQRADAEQLLRRAENFITHVTVFAQPWPTVVQVDGEEVALAPGGELVLDTGEHELSFSLAGYLGERRQIRAVGNEWMSIDVSLLPLIISPFPERALSPRVVPLDDTAPQWTMRQRWIWSGVVLVSAAVATGLGFGLSARHPDERAPIAANPVAIRRGP